MKRMLLASAALAFLPASAYAATCTTVTTIGNIQFVQGSSDSMCNDGDDLKFFADGVAGGTTITGSLGKNSQVSGQQNISFTSTGSGFDASTDGNGFANFKSIADDVNAYTATPINGSTLATDGSAFPGFDGELFRGQLANFTGGGNTTPWDGDVSVIVTLSDGTKVWHTYTGFSINNDIGTLGFDEIAGAPAGIFVTSVEAFAGNLDSSGNPLTAGEGSWDQYKQIEISVPGQIASIPEPRTWVMLGLGFAALGMVGAHKRRSISIV